MNIRDKILIVEDERSITNFLRTILTSNDYDVIIARSGAEAYSMITSHCPDLIVLDLGLPDIDGLQIIKSVREWTLLPIVVVSARAATISPCAFTWQTSAARSKKVRQSLSIYSPRSAWATEWSRATDNLP